MLRLVVREAKTLDDILKTLPVIQKNLELGHNRGIHHGVFWYLFEGDSLYKEVTS